MTPRVSGVIDESMTCLFFPIENIVMFPNCYNDTDHDASQYGK